MSRRSARALGHAFAGIIDKAGRLDDFDLRELEATAARWLYTDRRIAHETDAVGAELTAIPRRRP